jgi:hypothetical protein
MLYEFEIWQGGTMVASGSGNDREQVHQEAMHYASVYLQDGPVEVHETGPKPSPPQPQRTEF